MGKLKMTSLNLIEPDLITAELADEVVAEAEAVTTLTPTPSPKIGGGEGARPRITLVRQVVEVVPGRDYVAEARAIADAAERVCVAARETFALARLRQGGELAQVRSELDAARAEVSELRQDVKRLPEMITASAPTPALPRRAGAGEARKVLEREPLFLDLETTGLSKKDRIVEVGVTDAEGLVLLSTLVNPGRHIPAEASQVNGVTDDLVADAPAWEEVAPALERLLAGRVVVAHNAKFEAKFLPASWGIEWVCSKELADRALGKADYWDIAHSPLVFGGSLNARLYQCGLQPGPEHSAAGDCISAARLVKYLAGDARPVELIY
jgi:DNA polymerase-3 subunit epsilon